MRLGQLVTALCFLTFVTSAGATAFFIVNADGAFYVAGDTITVEESTISGKTEIKSTCKMIVSNQYVIAELGNIAHPTFNLNPLTGWSRGEDATVFKDQAKNILSNSAGPEVKFQQLIGAAKAAAKEEFDYRRLLNHQEVAPGNLSVALFFLDNGVATVKGFSAVSNIRDHTLVTNVESEFTQVVANGKLTGIGEDGALTVLPPFSRQQILRKPVVVLNAYLKKQTELTPDLVRPPYVIFRLTESGGKWIQPDAVCN
jgi:hypothetical protein